MSDVGSLVDELVAAGTPAGLAASIVARAFVAGAQSAPFLDDIETSGAARTRRWRERKASQSVTKASPVTEDQSVTKASQGVTNRHSVTPENVVPLHPVYNSSFLKEESKEERKKEFGGSASKSPLSEVGKFFDIEIWPVAPKRAGNNSRKDARAAFVVAVKNGADPHAVKAGLIGYAAYCRAENLIGTPFVKQLGPWLRAALWEGYQPVHDPPASVAMAPPGAPTHEELLAKWSKKDAADTPETGCETNGTAGTLQDQGSGVHQGDEGGRGRQGPVLCSSTGDARVRQLDRVLSSAVRAVTVGVPRREQ